MTLVPSTFFVCVLWPVDLKALFHAIKVNWVSEWLDSEKPGNSEQCCTEQKVHDHQAKRMVRLSNWVDLNNIIIV